MRALLREALPALPLEGRHPGKGGCVPIGAHACDAANGLQRCMDVRYQVLWRCVHRCLIVEIPEHVNLRAAQIVMIRAV